MLQPGGAWRDWRSDVLIRVWSLEHWRSDARGALAARGTANRILPNRIVKAEAVAVFTLLLGTIEGRVVVKGDRAPEAILRQRVHGRWMPMQGEVGRRESDETPKRGQDSFVARGHVSSPELEMPIVVVGPIIIQVEEYIDTAVQPV